MTERSRVRIPAGVAGEFSSPGSTFCADSYFRVTAVARIRSLSFCQKCRWQVTAKTRMHLTYVALHEVTGYMVVWCTQNTPRRQQFHVAPAMPAL